MKDTMDKCAFDLDVKCSALTKKECDGCAFYKTKAQLNEGRKRALRLLGKFTPQQRQALRERYYNGR